MSLKILQWNACGLLARSHEFRQAVATQKLDIICLQETFLKQDNVYRLSGYNCIRRDRVEPRGGLAFFIREGIKYTIHQPPADVECQSVSICTSAGSFNVINVYLPPVCAVTPTQLDDLLKTKNTAIVVGDMNARNQLWGADTDDTRGQLLEDAIATHNYVVLNTGQGTRQSPTGSMSHIDVSLASRQLATKCGWTTLNNTMGSDHVPIVITVNAVPDRELATAPRWKCSKADWSAFRRLMEEQLTGLEVKEDDDIDSLNDHIADIFRQSADHSVPQTKPSSSKRLKPLPYWNDEIKRAIRDRNRARNKMNLSKNMDDCIEYKRRKAIAQRVIRTTARQHWQNFCDQLTNTTRLTTVWNMAKKMNGTRSNPATAPLVDSGRCVITNQEKAEVFARTFAKTSSSDNYSQKFRQHKDDIEQHHAYQFANDAPATAMSEHLNKDFTQRELRLAITQLKKNTATGDDRIAYEFFQQMPTSGRDVILKFYNAIWNRGRLPKAWKHAVVLPILKVGKDPQQASSYRPISLTSTMSKLMERLVTSRLMWYWEKFGLLNNTQSGFRQGRSTADHITRLQDLVTRHQHNKGHVLAVFVDFEKAFDMVWRNGLMIKLKSLGINGRMFSWIADFFTSRTLQVRVGSALSGVYVLENGTSQGSMISPAMFIGMIDDLPSSLQHTDTSLFADDSALFKAGRNIKQLQRAIQKDLNALQHWCDTWGFKISVEKTVAVLFTRSPEKPAIQLDIEGKTVKVEKSAKFLGVVFDQQLTWNNHINHVVSKCNKRLNLMRAVSGTSWGATHRALIAIYRALIRSVLDYGAAAYDSASASQLRKIDSIQYSALRLCCGAMKGSAASALQVECGEMPLHLRRLQQQIKFAVKVKATPNHVAKSIFDDHWTTHYGIFGTNNRPMAMKVAHFFEELDNTDVKAPTLANTPPWIVDAPKTDITLSLEVSKQESPDILLALARGKIDQQYGDWIHIYTDASKTTSGQVGIGCYIQPTTTSSGTEESARLSDGVTIQTGEMTAIKRALELIRQLEQTTTSRKFAIFTDSLSSIATFSSGRARSRPNLLADLMDLSHSINSQVTLVWVPSHIGIRGNETADRLAKTATDNQSITYDIGFELQEAYRRVDAYIKKRWQEEWNAGKTGRHFHSIQPDVQEKQQRHFSSRSAEVLAHRLRLGRCLLNSYLYQMGKHDTGNCSLCGSPETIRHFVMECPANRISASLRKMCHDRGMQFDLQTLLSNPSIAIQIHRLTDRRL